MEPTQALTTNAEVTEATDRLLSLPMVEWATAAEGYTDNAKAELTRALDGRIERAARLRAYLDARGGLGCGDHGHAAAVKRSNRLAAAVRRALGFTYPKHDLSF